MSVEDFRSQLRYDLCACCRKVPPRPTFCLCTSCNSMWINRYSSVCASCGTPFEEKNHKEICQACYDKWSSTIPEEIYMIPPTDSKGYNFKSGMCARCRREPVWVEKQVTIKDDKAETVEKKRYLCPHCFNEWRRLPGPILCASCGKCRCVPHGEICKECKELIDDLNETQPYKPSAADTLVLRPCRFGAGCKDMTERHITAFLHGPSFEKELCGPKGHQSCESSDIDHIRTHIHPRPELSLIPMQHANLRDMKNPDAVMLNPEQAKYFVTDFKRNTVDLLEKARAFVLSNNGGADVDKGVFEEIRSWFMCHRPVHQCSRNILLSCIKFSKLLSRVRLRDMVVSTDEIANSIMMDPSVRSMFNFRSGTLSYSSIERYVFLTAKKTQCEITHKKKTEDSDLKKDLEELKEEIPKKNWTKEEEEERKSRKAELERVLPKDVVDTIEKRIEELFNEMINLYLSPTGIGNTSNIGTRTNFTIFTVVGPHYGGYSNDCQIVLHEDVMFHPDFYMLPVASTSYQSGSYRTGSNCGRGAFLGPAKSWGSSLNPYNDAMVDLCRDKLSPAIPEWADAMTYEWIARVHVKKGIPISSIRLNDVKQTWTDLGGYVNEGHLPQIVPRHYWKRLYLNEATYDFIQSDPKGKEFLNLMGKKVVKVVAGKDPNREATKYMESAPPDPYRPCGFTFSMNPQDVGEEVPIPFTLPTDRSVFIYFSSTKGIFDVILSNVADYFSRDVPRSVVTLHFDNQSRALSVDYSVGPNSASTGQKPPEQLGEKGAGKLFDSGVDSDRDGCIRYRICIDNTKKPRKLLISHTGRSRIRSPSELEVEIPDECQPLTSLSFASRAPPSSPYLTTIWDVFFTTEELDEPELVKK